MKNKKLQKDVEKKSFFGILKGVGRMTIEDETNICPNLEKRFLKEK